MEDKKCRICGFADMANPNIFQSNTKLVEKIVAVFPIVLYPNDPLPKHICKKCMLSTSTMYADIERAMRNQSKWISNVRSVQPDNIYVKVVDSIESANRQTAQLVSKITGEEIGERTVCHLLNFKLDETNHQTKSQCNNKPEVAPTMDKSTSASFGSEKDFEVPRLNIEPKSLPRPASFKASAITAPTKITQLKTVLELNGCTLTKLKPPAKPSPPDKPIEIEQIKVEVEIKEEPDDTFLEDLPQYSVICKLCSFQCETVEELAIHQLNHLTLSVPRLMEKKYLDKRTRRGRLIRVEEKKCIRCLNCWRIFVDNKSILHHWSNGDCDFYCQICGKEFPTSPKMLREHVPAAHGINFRSSRLLRRPPVPLKKGIKSESAPTSVGKPAKKILSTEALSVKVACNICMKVFANFKARNSHMRAHKHPPFLPAQPPPSLSETLLQFNRTNQMPIKEEMQDYDDIPYHIVRSLDTTAPSTSRAVPPIVPMSPMLHPSPKIIPHRLQKSEHRSNSPAGIRTKFVQIRPNPNSTGFKSDPDLSSSQLKVKSLIDLQDPSVTSQQLENADKSSLRTISTTASSVNGGPTTNGLGMAIAPKDNMNYGQIFNCHPCGGKFASKLELFRHKRKCTANNLFPCQFCSRYFLTSADLQMHIMLLHKSTSPQ